MAAIISRNRNMKALTVSMQYLDTLYEKMAGSYRVIIFENRLRPTTIFIDILWLPFIF